MTAETGPAPAAAGSRLASYRERRQKVADKLFTDLETPRVVPPAYLRCRPISGPRIAEIQAEATAAGAKDYGRDVRAAKKVIAETCLAIYELAADGNTEVALTDGGPELDVFGAKLGEYFETSNNAGDQIDLLFLTDGDIIRAANQVIEFAGFSDKKIAERVAGE